jgi:primosomal protein N' (replication factor Y) (superfamily II helicase)
MGNDKNHGSAVTKYTKYASVLLDLAVDKVLYYGVPQEQEHLVERGVRVAVPVRGFQRYGYVVDIKEEVEYPRIKPLSRVVSDGELITKETFELALWMSRYYCAPLRNVLKAMVPGSVRGEMKHKEQLFVMRNKTREELAEVCKEMRNTYASQAAVLDIMLKVKKGIFLTELIEQGGFSQSPVMTLQKKGLITLEKVRVDRSPLVGEEYFRTKAKKLFPEQQQALETIVKSVEGGSFDTHLLYGITGSGKTEVYLQALQKAIEMGKGTIMLVPEIALTAQTIERFKSRFDEYIAILHHRLSAGERYDEWHKIHKGEARIVIGARSAIFAPVHDLGLIIVDEEHEGSYKQTEEAPCYNARDVAVMRGYMSKATVLLGSATPSIESYSNAKSGKYTLSVLPSRVLDAKLPTVKIVDMKEEYERNKGYTLFSDALIKALQQRFEDGEQSIIFLNRRGYHTSLLCLSCREVVKCDHCDLAMTFHYDDNVLTCHLCGASRPSPRECPSCKSPETMKYSGIGTEKVERMLHGMMPNIRTVRVDADTTKHKGSFDALIRDFRTGKADVLIGTQMVAKGLHFPQVTLVGVLNSDASLNIPDFRSSERVFQLITQVAGRAGRGDLPGEVILQTSMPENGTICHASEQDYIGFYEEEIEAREMFGYPPYSHLVKITCVGAEEREVISCAEEFYRKLLTHLPSSCEVMPVVPSGYTRVKDTFRYQFFVKGKEIYHIADVVAGVKKKVTPKKGYSILIDVDPLSTFF